MTIWIAFLVQMAFAGFVSIPGDEEIENTISNFENIKQHMYATELKEFCRTKLAFYDPELTDRLDQYRRTTSFSGQETKEITASCGDNKEIAGPIVEQLRQLLSSYRLTKNDLFAFINGNLSSPCFAPAIYRPSSDPKGLMEILSTINLTTESTTINVGQQLEDKMDLAFFQELYPQKPFPYIRLPKYSPSYQEYFSANLDPDAKAGESNHFYLDLKVVVGKLLRENTLEKKIAYLDEAEGLEKNYRQLLDLGIIPYQR